MCVRSDAAGDVLSRTTNLPLITFFTIMGWFKITVDRNAASTFFQFGQVTDTGNSYQIQTAADGTTMNFWNGTATVTGAALTVGKWYHMALAVSGNGAGQATFFLDGVPSMSGNGSSAPVAEKIFIGNSAGSEFLNGCYEAIKIFDYPMNQAQVIVERKYYDAVFKPRINSCYPVRSVGEAIYDASGYARLLTSGGTLTTEDKSPHIIPVVRRLRRYQAFAATLASAGGGGSLNLTGSLTLAGASTKLVSSSRVGALTLSGAASKAALKALSGSFALGGALARAAALKKALSGSLSLAGASQRAAAKGLAGSVALTGLSQKSVAKLLAGSTNLSGVTTKKTSKSLTGGLTLSATFQAIRVILKALAGGIAMSGAITKQTGKVFARTLTLSGVISLQKTLFKMLTGAIALSGIVTRSVSKNLVSALEMAGSVTKSISKALTGSVVLSAVFSLIPGTGGAVAAGAKWFYKTFVSDRRRK